MKSWNKIWIKKTIHVWINIHSVLERIERTSKVFESEQTKVFESEQTKKIHSKITIIRRTLDSVYIKERRKTTSVYGLSKTEWDNNQESLFIIQY